MLQRTNKQREKLISAGHFLSGGLLEEHGVWPHPLT
jgi:hypothetical protein